MTTTIGPVVLEHHRTAVLGTGERSPRLSWHAPDGQLAYELEISDPLGVDAPFSSGRVESSESVLLPWPAAPLESNQRRNVRVRIWQSSQSAPSSWSDPTMVETGLLDPSLWQALMVSPGPTPNPGNAGSPAVLMRREIHVPGDIVRARLRATAQGVMLLHLNGTVVGVDVLNPGWSSYPGRLRYRTWDVTGLLREGGNCLGVHLADGWFRGYLGFAGMREIYGNRTAALIQLEIEHVDGTRTVVGTDSRWRHAPGPVTRADLYMGETHDMRLAQSDWDRPGFDDSQWDEVQVLEFDRSVLVAPEGPPVRRTQRLSPERIFSTPSGAVVADFGQNLVGRLAVRVPAAPAGTRIGFRHAEVLEHGELALRPLRAARQFDELVLDGSGPTRWEPDFTFHGFRYVQVDGWPGALEPEALEAVVLHTDMRRVGTFSCSDPLLDRFHENVVWGMRGNFLDVPTDCPQRDERLGWTGDLQIFAPTASFLYDTAGMLTGWLADLALDQHPDGTVPPYVPWAELDPDIPPLGAEAGWGDAATVVPWTLYERYGDPGILRTQWASMVRWVNAFAARAGDDLDFSSGGFSFGDWLDSSAADDKPWDARVPWQLVATAYLSRSARIVADTAAVLGHREAETGYRQLAERVAARFRSEYFTETGRASYPAQTAYALAIVFDLLLPSQRGHAGDLLAEQVALDGFHIGSGFLGTPLVCDALAETGHGDTAWRLLLQRECPSWLYPVTMGATTIWERWNSLLPDGSVNPGGMTSFNHYAFGAVADFMHRRVAGLAPAAPGYKRLRIAPLPNRSLAWARAEHETPYGLASVSWRLNGEDFELTVQVPEGTEAQIALPDGSAESVVSSGTHTFSCALPPESIATAPVAFSPA